MTNGAPPQDYGRYRLTSAKLISIPQVTEKGVDFFASPPWQEPQLGNGPTSVKRRLSQRFVPYTKRRRLVPVPPVPVPVPPPPPPITSVGVMDIGQGNCNMLVANGHPLLYYDLGYPLHFYVGSLPNNMRHGNPAYLGPIPQNTAGNLQVLLSHWDWDHWRLGHVAGINNIPWIVPNQPLGGAALVFYNTLLANGMVGILPSIAAGGPAILAMPNWTIYNCTPPVGMMAAGIMNNTGLAVSLNTNLPAANPAWHQVLLTADANFNSLPAAAAFPWLMGITAVHHGSIAHGAAAGLPAPLVAGQGRIAYSCGVRQAAGGAWVRPYGFPVVGAVANYNAAGWGVAVGVNERTTAEGPNINQPLPTVGPRGNIHMGAPPAMNGAYGATAFFNFPNALP